MNFAAITPILNVSDIPASVKWFEALGWSQGFQWGDPVSFGSVIFGDDCQIFLCLDGQGGRGKGANTTTFKHDHDEQADKGVWMSLWVDDVDKVHQHCLSADIEVTLEPTDMPWNVREMHIRHPDGHVFRISRGIE